ncbi:hypothetical protein MNB_SV-14-1435 [hydrothermal vent metagenome]|uniref:Uncharacterized protein n=1 Tax=hydrothermal vent metagenome TaxID=652676 RepID=A0A1W1C9M8_9ZZZZ
MAKKKKKIFQKTQLLSLFNSGNYKKVISKIKQFSIEGMSDDELKQIQVTSYKRLATSNFERGDINRAIKDIESLLTIEENDEHKLIKLKYLCYMEHFEDAIYFAQDLIVSKNLKIKKEAMFFYLLANIYSENYEIEKKNLKLLPIARQNYILAFTEFLKGNKEEALILFDKCNPRAKIEKEHIKVIKAIIKNEEYPSSEFLKPLYRFLINGDDRNLQNTKNSREIKKEILLDFDKNRNYRAIENLLSLKSSTTTKIITTEVKDKEKQTRLIYNNIILLIEKQRNIKEALDIFIKNRNSLVQFVESGILFVQIKSLIDDSKSDRIMLSFFDAYLKLHHKKLSEFQLNFIFITLLKTSTLNGHIEPLIKKYGGEEILFLFKDMALMQKVEPWHKDRFNNIMKKHSLLKDKALDGLADYIDILDKSIDKMDAKEKQIFIENLYQIVLLFGTVQKPNKKYKTTIFKILSKISNFIQNFEFSENSELYIETSETINRFIEIYKVDKADLSEDIKNLFESIDKKKSIKKRRETTYDKNIFDMFKDIIDDSEVDFEDIFGDDLDEEYLDDYDLEQIKKDFIEALKNNENPFNSELEDIHKSFDKSTVFEFILDLVAKAIEFDRYDEDFTIELLKYMYIEIENSYYREDLIAIIRNYAKKDIKTATTFFYDCITLVPTNQRETAWYLKWLETYIYLIDDYKEPKDKAFKACLNHFIKVQEKKQFKSLNSRFKKLIEKFKNKGLF